MTDEEFENIKRIAAEDTAVPDTELNIIKYGLNLPSRISKWGNLLERENQKLIDCENKMNEEYSNLLDFYKFKAQVMWSTQKEVDAKIKGDPKFIAVAKEYAVTECRRDYVKDVMRNLSQTQLTIKSYIEYCKTNKY